MAAKVIPFKIILIPLLFAVVAVLLSYKPGVDESSAHSWDWEKDE